MSTNFGDSPMTPQPYEPSPPAGAPFQPPGQHAAFTPPWQASEPPPPQKKSWGCVGCLIGCLGVTVVCGVLAGIAVWWAARQIPEMARKVIDEAVQQSDLTDEDKRVVMQQVDRFVDGYKQGKVGMQDLGEFFENLSQSPLMSLMIAYGAQVKYIQPSGLSDEEKQQAERTLQRMTRGVLEEKISKDDLDAALDHISTDKGNGAREFHESVSDDELRQFLSECKALADQAEIPDEDFRVDIGAELKKLVDKALGEAPATPLPEAP